MAGLAWLGYPGGIRKVTDTHAHTRSLSLSLEAPFRISTAFKEVQCVTCDGFSFFVFVKSQSS
jgi:hypothetical protein